MTEKVKLPQKVADAIEFLKKNRFSDESIIEPHSRNRNGWMELPADALNGMSLLTLVDALRIGYEVEPEYKVGDWVASLDTGNIYELVEELESYENLQRFKVKTLLHKGGAESWTISVNYVRHVTPEESRVEKERRLWWSIGRKVGEFRDGDVIFEYDRAFCGVSGKLTDLKNSEFINSEAAKEWYQNGLVKGLYPAESFVSFEEGDEG